MTKHITILGKLPSKFLADFSDPQNEIWSMNLHDDEFLIPRVDVWFDLHRQPKKESANLTIKNFPFEECHKLVEGRRFCSTAAYLIAYAIVKEATKISLYGMKFIDDGNLRRQRELHNVREMIFFAMGKGIEIEICEDDIPYLFPEHIPEDGVDFDQ